MKKKTVDLQTIWRIVYNAYLRNPSDKSLEAFKDSVWEEIKHETT